MANLMNLDVDHLQFPKARFLMALWGLLIVLAGIITQYFDLPNPNYVLFLWGGVTVLGFIGQAISLVRGLNQNYVAWLIVAALGWIFTFYVIKWDNGAHIDLYGDLAGVWLILLGFGYLATAYHVSRRFLTMAVVAFVGGLLLEISARGIVSIDFLNANSSVAFGLIAGVPLIIAALPMWYRESAPAPSPVPTEG